MTIKSILLTLIASFFCMISFSQDIMIMKSGDELKVKVIEVLPDAIKYKKWDNQDGPTEKNKKQDEAKVVKINLGRKDGLFIGYDFIVIDINTNSSKSDIVASEVFENYSLCKVHENKKRILDDFTAGKKLKIKTSYKP